MTIKSRKIYHNGKVIGEELLNLTKKQRQFIERAKKIIESSEKEPE